MVPSSGVSKLLSRGCLPRASASWPSIRARLPLTATVKVPPRDWVMVTNVSAGIITSVPEGTSLASTSRFVRTTSRSRIGFIPCSCHRKALATPAFRRGIGVAEAEQGVNPFGDKVYFNAVDQRQVLLPDVHIDTVDMKDVVIGSRLFYPLGFVFKTGTAAFPDRQANASGFRLFVELLTDMPDRCTGHGHVHIAVRGEDFGGHVSTSSGKQVLDFLQA